jgi:hypothetical protein
VSTASCDDIALDQALAEIDVASRMFDAYYKQLLMTEYASDYAMEADTSDTSTKAKTDGKKWYQKAWEAIKNFFIGIGRWFARQFGKIRDLFRRNKSVVGKAASAMNDEVLATAVTEEFNKNVKDVKGTSDITPGCVLYLINDKLLFSDGKGNTFIEQMFDKFGKMVEILKDGDMEELTKYVDRNNGPSGYDEFRSSIEELEGLIMKSKERGSKEISKDDLEEFATTIKDGKIEGKLNEWVSRANGYVTALQAVKTQTIYAKDKNGMPIVDENGNGNGVPGFKVDDKAMQIVNSWQKAFTDVTNRLTVILTTLQQVTETFVNDVVKTQRKAGEPTQKDTEAQAKLKNDLAAKYKK